MSELEFSVPGEVDHGRRRLLKGAMAGSVLLLGNEVVVAMAWAGDGEQPELRAILVDYSKCAGCRLCEMFCSSANAAADGLQSSLGNPYYARIKISNFNPDVDVVTVCAMCPDTPCVTACTVDPDPATGRKAIYRDPSSGVIRADASRCVACGSCEAACVTGTIRLDKPRNKPMGMCSLCDGDPQCVKRCPFGALSMTTVDVGREFFGQRPEVIFKVLSKRLYGGI